MVRLPSSALRAFFAFSFAVFSVVACATSLSSLPAFPCAEDGTCPDGFACDPSGNLCQDCGGNQGPNYCSDGCTNTQTDSNNCGACGTSCGDGSCVLGTCACTTSTDTFCGSGVAAVCTNLSTDSQNCGACGTVCPNAETCTGGKCGCTAAGTTYCSGDGECTNLSTDTQNCGACGTVCTGGQVCTAGQCGCPSSDPNLCAGTCTNTETDSNNCGGCGTVCPGTETCSGGTCGCGSNTICPGDQCEDLQTSTSNCGACGNACPPTQVCTAGQCECPEGDITCPPGSTTCTNPATDDNNCGSCGVVCSAAEGQTCTMSMCACAGGALCTVFPECGCGAGQQCVQDSSATGQCEPIGSTPTGGSCTSSADCIEGDACSTAACDGNSPCEQGICQVVCGTGSTCPSGTTCAQAYSGTTALSYSVCLPECDPVNPFTATATTTACTANQRCVLTLYPTAAICVPATGSGESGESCSNESDCAPDYTCVHNNTNQTSEATGSCQLVCATSATCATISSESVCTLFSGDSYGWCSTPCNVASPEEPEAGEVSCAGRACIEFDATPGTYLTGCFTVTEDGTAGSSCTYGDQCAAGYACYYSSATATSGTCVQWCTLTGGECSNGEACNGFSPTVSIYGVEYGICNGTATPTCTTNTTAATCPAEYPLQCSATLCCPSSSPYACLNAPTSTACHETEAEALAACPDECAVCTAFTL